LLLESSTTLISHVEVTGLFAEIANYIRRLEHEMAALSLFDPESFQLNPYAAAFSDSGFVAEPVGFSVADAPAAEALRKKDPVSRHRLDDSEFSPELASRLRAAGIRSICVLPLFGRSQPLGILSVGSTEEQSFTHENMEVLRPIAAQVAFAIENARNHELAAKYRERSGENDRYRLLLELNNAIVSNLALRDLFFAVSKSLQSVIHHDLAQLSLYDAPSNSFTFYAIDSGERQSKGFLTEGKRVNLDDSPTMKYIIREQKTWRSDRMDQNPPASKLASAEGLISGCSVPLISRKKTIGVLSVGSFREAAFTDDDVELLLQIGGQVAISVENALAYKQIEELKNTLAKEKLYLEEEIRSEYFDEIVGESKPLQHVLEQLQTVADTDATVLILGETGTGKELIARALHNQSRRKTKTFIKLNCSAIPTGLLESELFGHERGAFTGAIAQKIGRLELADKGTLFLDEIGDIPPELQPKLLRALQEMEFERLGSTRTLKVDVRLIAATNRDLPKMVAQREFRSDLYYRLNVFPIAVPPLRERPDDIPRLVRHFVTKYAQRLNRQIDTIPSEAMQSLQQWHWPGNVRELENFMERAVILSRGNVLNVPISELRIPAVASAPAAPKGAPAVARPAESKSRTLEESEREHILKVLAATKWVISGPDGAAAKLGLKRTTLQGKMKKLGIMRSSS